MIVGNKHQTKYYFDPYDHGTEGHCLIMLLKKGGCLSLSFFKKYEVTIAGDFDRTSLLRNLA